MHICISRMGNSQPFYNGLALLFPPSRSHFYLGRLRSPEHEILPSSSPGAVSPGSASVTPAMTVRASLLLLLSSHLTVSRRKSSQDLEKYFAASTEDTAKLFQLEKDLWELVLRYNDSSASMADRERIRQFVSQSHFDKVLKFLSLCLMNFSSILGRLRAVNREIGIFDLPLNSILCIKNYE